MEQEVYTESSEAELAELQKYGFGNQRAGVFARLQVSVRRGGRGRAALPRGVPGSRLSIDSHYST